MTTIDWHPQDWIIVLEALQRLADRPDLRDGHWRRERCEKLIQDIASEHGLSPSELASHASISGDYK